MRTRLDFNWPNKCDDSTTKDCLIGVLSRLIDRNTMRQVSEQRRSKERKGATGSRQLSSVQCSLPVSCFAPSTSSQCPQCLPIGHSVHSGSHQCQAQWIRCPASGRWHQGLDLLPFIRCRREQERKKGTAQKHARSIVALQCLSTFLPSAITKISSV